MRRLVQLSFAWLLGACPTAGVVCAAEAPNPRFTGAPFLRAWTAEDYEAAPVNYQLLQHPGNGCLYFSPNSLRPDERER